MMIPMKSTNEYKDYHTKDIKKWQKIIYQPQTTSSGLPIPSSKE